MTFEMSSAVVFPKPVAPSTMTQEEVFAMVDWRAPAPVVRKSVFKFSEPKDEIDQAIQAFLSGAKEGRFKRYHIHGDRLLFKSVITERSHVGEYRERAKEEKLEFVRDLLRRIDMDSVDLISPERDDLELWLRKDTVQSKYLGEIKYQCVKANVIAIRIGEGTYVGNSSALSLIGRHVSFGREHLNRGETEVQKRLSVYIPMIPFNVFQEADLDIMKFKQICKGPEERVIRSEKKYDSKKKEEVTIDVDLHFIGASVFDIEGKTFLFDIDRNEIRHKIFNAFLVELPRKVASIEDAYESLMPDEVKAAMKAGLDVKRQGEWFFIPVEGKYQADKSNGNDWRRKDGFRTISLRAGNNRPNEAEFGVEKAGVVWGLIRHSGREHADLFLNQPHKTIPNTATRSFTIKGEVD